jgi:hypothetical protein
MEFTKTEIALVQEASQEANEQNVRELTDLQLALVGGGMGDVIFG